MWGRRLLGERRAGLADPLRLGTSSSSASDRKSSSSATRVETESVEALVWLEPGLEVPAASGGLGLALRREAEDWWPLLRARAERGGDMRPGGGGRSLAAGCWNCCFRGRFRGDSSPLAGAGGVSEAVETVE